MLWALDINGRLVGIAYVVDVHTRRCVQRTERNENLLLIDWLSDCAGYGHAPPISCCYRCYADVGWCTAAAHRHRCSVQKAPQRGSCSSREGGATEPTQTTPTITMPNACSKCCSYVCSPFTLVKNILCGKSKKVKVDDDYGSGVPAHASHHHYDVEGGYGSGAGRAAPGMGGGVGGISGTGT